MVLLFNKRGRRNYPILPLSESLWRCKCLPKLVIHEHQINVYHSWFIVICNKYVFHKRQQKKCLTAHFLVVISFLFKLNWQGLKRRLCVRACVCVCLGEEGDVRFSFISIKDVLFYSQHMNVSETIHEKMAFPFYIVCACVFFCIGLLEIFFLNFKSVV